MTTMIAPVDRHPSARDRVARTCRATSIETATAQRRNLMIHHLEEAFVRLVDVDPEVTAFVARPALTFEFVHRGKPLFWAPSFLVGYARQTVLWDFSSDLSAAGAARARAEVDLREKLAWIARCEGFDYALATPRTVRGGVEGLRRVVTTTRLRARRPSSGRTDAPVLTHA